MKRGTLRLKTIALNFSAAISARVMLDGRLIQATMAKAASQVTLTFAEDVLVAAGQALEIRFA